MHKDLFERLTKSMESFNEPKPFILSTKQREYFVEGMGLEGLKQYVRDYGFDRILIIDKFGGLPKEEIVL